MSKELVPNIRFKGFNQEWKNKLFKSLTYPTGEKNKENKEYESYSITNESGFIPQKEKFSKGGTMKNADKSLYYIVQPNTFAYNPARINVGSIGYQNLSFPVIVSSLYVLFKTTGECHDDFLVHWFKSDYFSQQVLLTQEGGVRLYFFYDKLKHCSINLPQKNEQILVSNFFDLFNKEIIKVQTKLDKLYALKKTMLVKMFPQGDAIVPEIRLKGFNGEWSDSTLGHCFDERCQRDSTGELLSVTIADGVIRFSESGRTDNSSSDKSNYKKVEINDIAYNSMRMWQGACGRSLYSGIVSPAYTVLTPRSNTDSLFFAYLFKNPYLLHQFRIHSQGLTSDTWNLRFPAFSKIKIRKPHVNEQIAIGRYFQTLDKQLHLYEQKLSKLKNLKSAFLKNMFV